MPVNKINKCLNYAVCIVGECGGVVVEHQTPIREVLGSISTGGTMMCP